MFLIAVHGYWLDIKLFFSKSTCLLLQGTWETATFGIIFSIDLVMNLPGFDVK